MAGPGEHIANDFTKSDLHHAAGGRVGGKCLDGGHESVYKKSSCSYRFQGIYQIENVDRSIYERHPKWPHRTHDEQTGSSSSWESDDATLSQAKTNLAKNIASMISSGAFTAPRGQPYQAQKTYKSGKKKGQTVQGWRRLVRARRFRTAFSPYGNSPHHLVPWVQLGNAIDKACQPAKPRKADLVLVVCEGLASETYNVNHHYNILVLPHEFSDACKLLLPTHFTHPDYSEMLAGDLTPVFEEYKRLAQQLKKHGDLPDPVDVKDELEELAAKYKQLIIRDGEAHMAALCDTYASSRKRRTKVGLDALMNMLP